MDASALGHGVLDAIMIVFLFLLGIITNGLRGAINDSRTEQKKLSEAINQLTITLSKEYVTRTDNERANAQVWDRLDRHTTEINQVSERVTRLER